MKHNYSKMVEPHEKSISLGGAINLFPVPEALVQAFTRNIRTAIERAEEAAYDQGFKDAQKAMRKALGIK